METIKIIVLGVSGLLLLFVGIMRLTNPIKTYLKNSGITLANDVNLLNEMRGVSAVMLFSGVIILSGTFIAALTTSSLVVACLIFLGFAIGRIASQVADGKPNKQLVIGLTSELILGTCNAFFLASILAS